MFSPRGVLERGRGGKKKEIKIRQVAKKEIKKKHKNPFDGMRI